MGENANDRFERLAAEFYAATGMLAPGKDQPGAMGGNREDYDRRVDAWRAWNAVRTARVERDAARWRALLPLLGDALASRHFDDVNGPEMVLRIGSHELRCGATHGYTDYLVGAAVAALVTTTEAAEDDQ